MASYQDLMDKAFENEIYNKESGYRDVTYDFCDRLDDAVVNTGGGANWHASGKDPLQGGGHITVDDPSANNPKLFFKSAESLDIKIKNALNNTTDSWKSRQRVYRRAQAYEAMNSGKAKNGLKEFVSSKEELKTDNPSSKINQEFIAKILNESCSLKAFGMNIYTRGAKEALQVPSGGGTLKDDNDKEATVKFTSKGIGNVLNIHLADENQKAIDRKYKDSDASIYSSNKYYKAHNVKDEDRLDRIVEKYATSSNLVLQSMMHWGHAGPLHSQNARNKIIETGNSALFAKQVKQGYWDSDAVDLLSKTNDSHIYTYLYPEADLGTIGLVNTNYVAGRPWNTMLKEMRANKKAKAISSDDQKVTPSQKSQTTQETSSNKTPISNTVPKTSETFPKLVEATNTVKIRTATNTTNASDTGSTLAAGKTIKALASHEADGKKWYSFDLSGQKRYVCSWNGKAYFKDSDQKLPDDKPQQPATESKSKGFFDSISDGIDMISNGLSSVAQKGRSILGGLYDYVFGSNESATTNAQNKNSATNTIDGKKSSESLNIEKEVKGELSSNTVRNALEWYQDLESKYTPEIIKEIQEYLISQQEGAEFKVKATGVMDARTVQAIYKWQKRVGLQADAQFGPGSADKAEHKELKSKLSQKSNKKPRSFKIYDNVDQSSTSSKCSTGEKAVNYARRFLGLPYVWAAKGEVINESSMAKLTQGHGNDKSKLYGVWSKGYATILANYKGQRGFDCSGLCCTAYGEGVGYDISEGQGWQPQSNKAIWAHKGKPDVSQLKIGDVIVSDGHYAMYNGDKKVIESRTQGITENLSWDYNGVLAVYRYFDD